MVISLPPPHTDVVAKALSGMKAERRRDQSPSGVPVALRTVQHIMVSRGRFAASWSQRLMMAKWVISGAATMEVDGKRLPFGPGQVAIYLPTIPHRFWAEDEINEMCWFSVDGPLAEPFVLELGVRPGVYAAEPPSPARLREMADSLKANDLAGRRRASLLAMKEWYRLADLIGMPAPRALVADIRHLIAQDFANPELSTTDLARRLGYHRGSLSRLFREQARETIMDHLTQVRLREAIALLSHTDDTVALIGRQCGFREPSYFCRWFRKHHGSTPGDFRALQRSGRHAP